MATDTPWPETFGPSSGGPQEFATEVDAPPPLDDEGYIKPPAEFKPWIRIIEDGLRSLSPLLRPREEIREGIEAEAGHRIGEILATTEKFIPFVFRSLEPIVSQARTAGLSDRDIRIVLIDIPLEDQVRNNDENGTYIKRRVALSVVPSQQGQPGDAVLELADNFSDQRLYFRPSPTDEVVNIPTSQNSEATPPLPIDLHPLSLAQALREPALASVQDSIDKIVSIADVRMSLPSRLLRFSVQGITEQTSRSIQALYGDAIGRARAPQSSRPQPTTLASPLDL